MPNTCPLPDAFVVVPLTFKAFRSAHTCGVGISSWAQILCNEVMSMDPVLQEPAIVTRAQTPEVTDADPSPHATTAKSTGQGTPAEGTPNAQALGEGDGPRKRPSRTSKNAAMASWKANKMLDEDDEAEEDSRSEDGTRQSRRAKKVCGCENTMYSVKLVH